MMAGREETEGKKTKNTPEETDSVNRTAHKNTKNAFQQFWLVTIGEAHAANDSNNDSAVFRVSQHA